MFSLAKKWRPLISRIELRSFNRTTLLQPSTLRYCVMEDPNRSIPMSLNPRLHPLDLPWQWLRQNWFRRQAATLNSPKRYFDGSDCRWHQMCKSHTWCYRIWPFEADRSHRRCIGTRACQRPLYQRSRATHTPAQPSKARMQSLGYVLVDELFIHLLKSRRCLDPKHGGTPCYSRVHDISVARFWEFTGFTKKRALL